MTWREAPSKIGISHTAVLTFATALMFMAISIDHHLAAQNAPSPTEPREMLMTEQGFLAFNAPRGWVRTAGPGLAYFVPRGGKKPPHAWMYISSAPIGVNDEAKDLKAYIQSDIAGFKSRFRHGVVDEEEPLNLRNARLRAPVWTFRSGEKNNVVEQVVYISESARVLILVLSAKDNSAFDKALPSFREFAKSYGGSITLTPSPH